MSSPQSRQGLLPSVLDRLIDPASAGSEGRPGYGIGQILEAVRRDLEDLLNTRQTVTDLPPGLARLRSSIYCYGLPELIHVNALTPQHRQEIAVMLESTVARFEPRLRDVRAVPLETSWETQQAVHFRIEARLAMDPMPEVAFHTTLKLATGQHSVQQTPT